MVLPVLSLRQSAEATFSHRIVHPAGDVPTRPILSLYPLQPEIHRKNNCTPNVTICPHGHAERLHGHPRASPIASQSPIRTRYVTQKCPVSPPTAPGLPAVCRQLRPRSDAPVALCCRPSLPICRLSRRTPTASPVGSRSHPRPLAVFSVEMEGDSQRRSLNGPSVVKRPLNPYGLHVRFDCAPTNTTAR